MSLLCFHLHLLYPLNLKLKPNIVPFPAMKQQEYRVAITGGAVCKGLKPAEHRTNVGHSLMLRIRLSIRPLSFVTPSPPSSPDRLTPQYTSSNTLTMLSPRIKMSLLQFLSSGQESWRSTIRLARSVNQYLSTHYYTWACSGGRIVSL